jgi:ubiquinone/menaquinone biosynthesis C-methylase UbiE
MDHDDHVALLKKGIPHPGGTWADFGSGSGAFTLALADLLGPTAEIYSIDHKESSLRQQERSLRAHFPEREVHYLTADFTRSLDLPLLDGLIMANALHFQRQKDPLVQLIMGYLRPGGRLILVEYNVDRGNVWVPYPLSYPTWEKVAARNGLRETRLLETRPSRFLHQIYAALSFK